MSHSELCEQLALRLPHGPQLSQVPELAPEMRHTSRLGQAPLDPGGSHGCPPGLGNPRSGSTLPVPPFPDDVLTPPLPPAEAV